LVCANASLERVAHEFDNPHGRRKDTLDPQDVSRLAAKNGHPVIVNPAVGRITGGLAQNTGVREKPFDSESASGFCRPQQCELQLFRVKRNGLPPEIGTAPLLYVGNASL
jgi:hypothetical protein